MAPRIGVTACEHLPDYLEAVRRAGGDPHVLEPGAGPAPRLLDGMPAKDLKGLADDLKKQLGSGVIALVSVAITSSGLTISMS